MAGYQERMAARIRAERKSRGLSREEAARQAGISFRQFQRWETGQSEPRDGPLRQLAEAWQIPLEDLRPPNPEHEERDVREQLDRIEAMLDVLVEAVTGLSDDDVAARVVRLVEARAARDEPQTDSRGGTAPARARRGRAR